MLFQSFNKSILPSHHAIVSTYKCYLYHYYNHHLFYHIQGMINWSLITDVEQVEHSFPPAE